MPSSSAIPGQPASRRERPWSVAPVICTLVVSLALATSCASRAAKRAAAPSAPPAIALAVETRVGVVRAVGAGESFVLVETPSATATSALFEGQLLHCRPPGAPSSVATADLRVSRERHQSLVVANVIAGDPTVGAVVYAAPEPTPAPAPGPVSSLSTAPLSGLFSPRKP